MTSWADVACKIIQNCWAFNGLISRETLSLVPGSSNKFALVNNSAQLRELIIDFTGDS